jgi:predicted RNase H-like HicB family nuclease
MERNMAVFPFLMLKYNKKRKIRPPITGDTMDNLPLIALFGQSVTNRMTTKRKILQRILAGSKNIRFSDEALPDAPVLEAGRTLQPETKGGMMGDYHINIFYSEEDGGYIADIPDLEACSAFGETPEEALREVQLAKSLWLQAARAESKPIPPPKYRPVIYQTAAA